MIDDGPSRTPALPPGPALSLILKRLRRRRGLLAAEAAAALGMKLRAYEDFEAGRRRLNVPRVLAAAKLFNADPYLILLAVELGAPELALRCADNKLGVVFSIALEAFNDRVGDDIVHLDTQTLMTAFNHVFQHLGTIAAERARLAGPAAPQD